ncbi:MAG: hypothetical protein ACON35_00560 [Candidatus Marinamargulisbacteria bacterium]
MSIKEQISDIEKKINRLNDDSVSFEDKIAIYKDALTSVSEIKKTIEENKQVLEKFQPNEL